MKEKQKKQIKRSERFVSTVLADGRLVELIHNTEIKSTAFVVGDDTKHLETTSIEIDGKNYEPIPATNNLIKHEAVLLPETADQTIETEELVAQIKKYLYTYVDLTETFQTLATYYILLTWVYDVFNELPYLRFRGDYGSGKSRALTVVGSVTYKGFFASGASTVSPIFHTLDLFKGTLIIDEADFRFSDEKSELVKIFNNGNVRGFPVLRTAITNQREFDPRAFSVFGPKIVAMRGSYEDQALESRFLTEEMGQRPLRKDIPINLPKEQKLEATVLRNKLLSYRLQNYKELRAQSSLVDPTLSARMNQIFVPLLSVIEDKADLDAVTHVAGSLDRKLSDDRVDLAEAKVLEVLIDLIHTCDSSSVSIALITQKLAERFQSEFERPITNRYVGGVLRGRLHLTTKKSHGVYVVPIEERSHVEELAIRYGVLARTDK